MALVAVVLAGAGRFVWSPVHDYAMTGASYGARVACSCRYLGGRPLGNCRKDLERETSWVMLSEDTEDRSVTATFPLIASQTATYHEGWGCRLEPWKN